MLRDLEVTVSREFGEVAIRHGRAKKRDNAIAAVLSGVLPAMLLSHYFPGDWKHWLNGVTIGLLWGNAFEYAYHRWLLHRPRSFFARGHREHHAQVGTPEEAEHVSLGRTPLNIAILFAINGAVAIVMELLLRPRIMPGIFAGWTVYFIAAEEIHWRVHMNGWLPVGLRFARSYHLGHHHIPNSRYNIFLPLFDLLLGNSDLRTHSDDLQVREGKKCS